VKVIRRANMEEELEGGREGGKVEGGCTCEQDVRDPYNEEAKEEEEGEREERWV